MSGGERLQRAQIVASKPAFSPPASSPPAALFAKIADFHDSKLAADKPRRHFSDKGQEEDDEDECEEGEEGAGEVVARKKKNHVLDSRQNRDGRFTGNIAQFSHSAGTAEHCSAPYQSQSRSSSANIGPGNESCAADNGSGHTGDRCMRVYDDVNYEQPDQADDDDNDGATFLSRPAASSRCSPSPSSRVAASSRRHLSSFCPLSASSSAPAAPAAKLTPEPQEALRRAGAHEDNCEQTNDRTAGGQQETRARPRPDNNDDTQAHAKRQQQQQHPGWDSDSGPTPAQSALIEHQRDRKSQEEEEDLQQQQQQAMGKRLGRPATLEEAVSSEQQHAHQHQLVVPAAARSKRPKRARTPTGDSAKSSATNNDHNSNCEPSSVNGQQQQQVSRLVGSSGKSTSNQLQNNNNNSSSSKCSVSRPSSSAGPQQRPASAMAGGLRSSSSSQMGSSREHLHRATSKQSSSNSLLATAAPVAKVGGTNGRTTRVRINSTSEQIQDPNWLIEMSKGYKSASSGKKTFHLKALQAKLKSTIGAVGGGGASSSSKSSSSDLVQTGPSDSQRASSGGQGACATPPMPPSTPVKVPVSILKQPSSQQQRASAAAAAARLQQTNPSSLIGPAGPVAAASAPSTANNTSSASTSASTLTNPTLAQVQQQTRSSLRPSAASTSTASAGNSSLRNEDHPASGRQPKAAVGATSKQSASRQSAPSPAGSKAATLMSIHQTTGSDKLQLDRRSGSNVSEEDPSQHKRATKGADQQQPLPAADHSPRPVPICADGQVKVSGWKRNNLLAKTLSHFDEIRGNQRPIFMPTKIRLPSEALSTTSGSPTVSLGQGGAGGAGGAKFADIVREAITKKSLLKEAQQQADSTLPAGHLLSSSSATKRASDAGERHLAALNQRQDTAGTSSSHGGSFHLGRGSGTSGAGSPAKRPFSADPGRSLGLGASASAASSSSSAIKKPQILTTSPAGGSGSHQHQHQPASMAHIIAAAVAAHADQQQHGSPSSSRAFKLQLKNEQVLQNLRRQSNELAREALLKEQNSENCAPELTSLASSSAANSGGQSRAGTHLKDWKRLSNKLSLLTGRGGGPVARSAACTPPNGSAPGAAASNLMSLRMTVSNQESESSSHRKSHEQLAVRARPGDNIKRRSGSGSGAATLDRADSGLLDAKTLLLVPGFSHNYGDRRRQSNQLITSTSSGNSAADREERRKLSSSSMIAVPVSATAHSRTTHTSRVAGLLKSAALSGSRLSDGRRLMCRSAANSPMDLSLKELQTLRRSSDSSACRQRAGDRGQSANESRGEGQGGSSCSNADSTTNLAPSSPASCAFTERRLNPSAECPQSERSSSSSSAGQRKPVVPIVVHRDDLIRLLQVNANGDEAAPGTSADLEDAQIANPESAESSTLRLPPDKTSAGQADNVDEEEGTQQQQQQSGSLSEDKVDWQTGAQSAPAAQLSSNEDESSVKKSSKPGPKTDLSLVVKRTSKVAYFQQKLRKMRWHSKQQQQSKLEKQQQQQETSEPIKSKLINDDSSDVTDGADAKTQSQTDKQEQQEQHRQLASGDILMDPNLIGDAIETFLRTTMQQQQQQQHEQGEQEQGEREEQEQEQEQGDKGLQEAGRGHKIEANNEVDGGHQLRAATHLQVDKCGGTSERGASGGRGGEEPSETLCVQQEKQQQQQQQQIQASS